MITMKFRYFLFFPFLSVIAAMQLRTPDFSTPEGAIKALEAAYIRHDIDAAVAAKDFGEEARLMLVRINPKSADDPVIVKKTAEVLELSFRKMIAQNGFPDFASLRCSLAKPQHVSQALARVTETCVFPDGGKSVQDLTVFNGAAGWRVVVVPP